MDFMGHLPILSYILKYSSKMTHNCLAVLPADFLRALVCASLGQGTRTASRGLPATYSPTSNFSSFLTGLPYLTDSAPAPGPITSAAFLPLWSTSSPGTCKAPFCTEGPVPWLQLRCPDVPPALRTQFISWFFQVTHCSLLPLSFQSIWQPPSSHILFGIVNKLFPGRVPLAIVRKEASRQTELGPYFFRLSLQHYVTAVLRNGRWTHCYFQLPTGPRKASKVPLL